MIEFTLWDIVRNLLLAARWTVLLSLIAFAGGASLGLVLLVVRTARAGLPAILFAGFVHVFQGTPLLMQLFLAYFGLPLLGIETSAWQAAILALTLYSSAFLAEIWRGCVDSVPRGQWEGAQSLALSFLQQLRFIILPQAFRIAIPPTVGFLVQVIKGTALASVIGFIELTKAGSMISNITLQPFLVYGFVALFYFALCYPVSLTARHLEARMKPA
ncbi:amino acid ABC transporter permease [Elioraea sp.]|uniref:amino acid ABC transporter permease n=1 Tax=Elioraea sp. TaxID=2185103 RepID=UPI0025C31627|nr:amino acid ABC transporter permease [Elioraea sp.]